MQTWIIAIVALSVVLFLLEIFFIPGVGLAGILAFVLLCVATYMASITFGTFTAGLIFFGTVAVVILAFIIFLRSPFTSILVLKDQLAKGHLLKLPLKPGMTGMCIADCHPSGKAAFILDGKERLIDVVTRGEFLNNGVQVEVIRIEGTKVLVRAK